VADRIASGRVIRAAWGAWTGRSIDLEVPAGWRIVDLTMRDAAALTDIEIDRALDEPLGAERLERLARSRRRVAIAIDDITRPTRTAPILSAIVRRLHTAGISLESMTVLVATGAHGVATARDIRLKVGELANRIRVVSHDPVHGLVDTGVCLGGQPVQVNPHYVAADLRIGVGGVMPHPFAGYSGGGKILLPGLSDLDSVVRSHKYALMGFAGGPQLEGNKFRRDMERAVREIGLDWTVNVVLNSRCETANVFAGDVVEAHRAAAARSAAIGETASPPEPLDALVLNAYPKDSELLQMEAALVAVRGGMLEWLRPSAPVVLIGAGPDGLGSHRLFGPGGRLFRRPAAKSYLRDRVLHVVSPATRADASRAAFWDGYPYHESWAECAAALERTLPPSPSVGYASAGPLHVASTARDFDCEVQAVPAATDGAPR
jgi:lactate racemase